MRLPSPNANLGPLCAPWSLLLWLTLLVQPAAAQSSSADLSVSFGGTPAIVSLGQYFNVSVSVLNSSVTTATNVVLTNLLPANATFIGAAASQGKVTHWSGGVS